VIFASGFTDPTGVDVVNVGAGGGPHHNDMLPVVDRLGQAGAELHVISVDPQGGHGRAENVGSTVERLPNSESVQVHSVAASNVATGLVERAAVLCGVLFIGATRTRRLRRWVFGSTPDRVVSLADSVDLPVLVYASPRGVRGPIEDYLYPVYRYFTGRRGDDAPNSRSVETEQ
jgi:hypothetical protein